MIREIFKTINNSHNLTIFIFLIVSIILAISDLLGALTISILVSFITDGSEFFKKKIPFLFEYLGTDKKEAFINIFILTSLFFYLSVLIRTIYGYKKIKFVNEIKIFIGKKTFTKFLNIPFSRFVKYTNAEIQTLLNFEAERFSACVFSIIRINEGLVSVLILFVSLIIIDFSYMIYFLIFSILFYLSYRLVKPTLLKNDRILRLSNIKMVDTINETISNIKLIKIQKMFSYFFEKFVSEGNKFSKSRTVHQYLPVLTKNVIEFSLFSLFIVIVVVYLNSGENNINELLPIITFFLVLAYRLIPSFQTIYAAIVSLSSSKSAITSITDNLKISDEAFINSDILEFKKNIKFKNISFKYNENSPYTHLNLNLDIRKNSLNVIIGKSGSGKSTFLDLFSGLLKPDDGEIKVDDVKLTRNNIISWQNKIGYMGQDLVLFNDTIKKNIEFGLNKPISDKEFDDILEKFFEDEEKVKFTESEFLVGERGSKISFGQRQRVILARQFFSEKEVILLDEPTSSLDYNNITKLKTAIKKIKGKKTILITSHNEAFNDIADQLINL